MTKSSNGDSAYDYVSKLDLGDDPFASDFVSNYYFSNAARQQLLDQLLHFSRFSDQLVMLVGPTGSGTSTILDRAINIAREVMDCCYINAEKVMTPDQVLASICQQLHIQFDDEPATNSAFFARLQAIVQVDDDIEPILIAVDQAHFLPLEGFELLNSIASESGDMVRLIVVGEYQIEQLAILAAFDREAIKLFELEALSLNDTGDFLLGLLQSVGYAGEQPFSTDQLAVLHQQSGGNIAELMQLAPALLSSSPSQQQSRFGFGIPVAHLIVSVIIAITFVAAWLYQGSGDTSGVVSVELPIPANDLIAVKEPAKPNRSGAIDRVGLPDIPEVVNTAPVTERQKPVKIAEANKAGTTKEPLVTGSIQPDAEPQPIVTSKPVVTKAPTELRSPKPAQEQRDSVVTTVNNAIKKDNTLPVREQRLMGLDGKSYMVQLIGAVDEQRTEALVKRYAGRLPVTYFETRYKNKPWFVAIVGPYASKELAVEKIKLLPQELQKQGPWPRSVASIQQDIGAKQR